LLTAPDSLPSILASPVLRATTPAAVPPKNFKNPLRPLSTKVPPA